MRKVDKSMRKVDKSIENEFFVMLEHATGNYIEAPYAIIKKYFSLNTIIKESRMRWRWKV